LRIPVLIVALILACPTISPRADAQTSAMAPAHPVLVIQSTPGGVQVYVDDEFLGTTSPEGRLKISTLKPGRHTLRVSLGGISYGEGQFSLATGKSVTKTVRLTEDNVAANQMSSAQRKPVPAAEPSLEDTLKWLADFLPSATGMESFEKPERAVAETFTASLGMINGCNIAVTNLYINEVGGKRSTSRTTYQFSLSEINSSQAGVGTDDRYDPPQITFVMATRGASRTVVATTTSDSGANGDIRIAFVPVASFVDRASAERVAKAFRHAAELCAKDQPF
jgi:hypothetical protein